MKVKFFTLASVHMLLALIVGVIFLYLTYVIVRQIFKRKKLPVENNNVALGIFTAAIMFTVGYIMSGIFEPAVATAQILMKTHLQPFMFLLSYLKSIGIFLLIAFVATILVVYTAIKVFDLLTASVDEFEEISKGNVAVSIIMSAMIIVVALLAKPSIGMLIEALIPYPEIPGFGM